MANSKHPIAVLQQRYLCVLMLALLVFSVLALAVQSAVAQTAPANLPCSSATTTADMLNCENQRYERSEQELNSAYSALMKKLDETGKSKLRAAQQAWLKFRTANAEFQADVARGGTLAEVIRITVLADMTQARSAELRKSIAP